MFDGAPHRILVVDDDERVRKFLALLLLREDYEVVAAASAREAEMRIEHAPPDLVLLDLNLGQSSGLDVLRFIRGNGATRLTPVVMMTAFGNRQQRLEALREGVTDFLDKPMSQEELVPRIRALVKLKTYTDALEDAERVIVALARMIDARDPGTSRHSERVSRLAGLLGKRIGLSPRELAAVERGGLFHDIGKIALRDAVLLKPGRLTPLERKEMERHPMEGHRLIKPMKSLAFALDVVTYHHERYDGSGYPEGLSGEKIPLTARVTTIADVYDAISSTRVYRAARSRRETLEIMSEETARGWWDPHLFDEFRGLMESIGDSDGQLLEEA